MKVVFEFEVDSQCGSHPLLALGPWTLCYEPLSVALFTRAQVGVCGTKLCTVRLWVRCVVTQHLVRDTLQIPTLPFGPSTLLEFFVCVGRIFQSSWLRTVLKSQFLRLWSNVRFLFGISVHWKCVNHRLHLRRGLTVWFGSAVLSRQIRRNLQYGLNSFQCEVRWVLVMSLRCHSLQT